jgi:hypothetical protein
LKHCIYYAMLLKQLLVGSSPARFLYNRQFWDLNVKTIANL